ncbi:MAG: helix-turn-helix transcriptional regulator [Mycobacteriales bacterium]
MTDATAAPALRRSARRTDLGDFLKARRARVRPQDVGMAPGDRRRTPGLRREEVALIAGVGVTWYTWLEQGRPINASAQVLDSVARALCLDRPERWHLYRLAEAVPVRAITGTVAVPDRVAEIVRALGPLPATLTNARYDILMSNAEHQDLFSDWHALPCVHKNLLWCAVTEPAAREKFLNYDTEVPYLVARLRANYGEHLGDPEWTEDIARLSALSPEFAQLWARHDVAPAEVRIRRFLHPVAGPMAFTMTELTVSEVPDARIVVHTPAEDESWARLPLTRRHADAAG